VDTIAAMTINAKAEVFPVTILTTHHAWVTWAEISIEQ
jgi:hypothetical protein